MFHKVNTAFSYGRALIVYLFLQESFTVKESSLHKIWNIDTSFLLSEADMTSCMGLNNSTCMVTKPHITTTLVVISCDRWEQHWFVCALQACLCAILVHVSPRPHYQLNAKDTDMEKALPYNMTWLSNCRWNGPPAWTCAKTGMIKIWP